MLTVNPDCRLTAQEALNHPWLCFVQVSSHPSLDTHRGILFDSLFCTGLEPFQIKEEHKIPARRRLKVITFFLFLLTRATFLSGLPQGFLTALWFLYHLKKLHRQSQYLNLPTLETHPYQHKYVRKLIDGCAFRMYGHWVKRGEQQNRAALFETNPRTLSGLSIGGSVLYLFHEDPVSWETFA